MPARIERQTYSDTFKLHVWRRWGTNADVLLSNGTWYTVAELERFPDNTGIEFSMQLLDEIFEAFMEYKGLKTHDPTEVKVLREWLLHETGRVDDMINKFLRT